MPPRGRALGRSMSVKDMKAERDAKLAQREAEKAAAGIVTSPLPSPTASGRASSVAVSPTKSPVAATGRSGRGRGLGRSMSVKDMKAERDAKLAQREAEKAEMAASGTVVSPLTSPSGSPRAGLVAPSPVSPAKAPAAASGRSGRARGLGRSMSVKDMKAERDAKLAQREAEKAEKAESPAASPTAQDAPATSPRSALRTSAVVTPAVPANAPSGWESMSKLEQIKWKKENNSRAQVKWAGAAANVKVFTAFNAAGHKAAAGRTAREEQEDLPTNWAEMSTTDRIKWRREHGKPAGWGSPQVSPTVSPRAATAMPKEPGATERAEAALQPPSATTEAALQRQVDELTRQREAILLAAIDEIKALEDTVEAYRMAVGTVEQAQALAASRQDSRPPEGVVPLTLRGITSNTGSRAGSDSPRGTADVASQESDDDNAVDMSESDDDSVDVSSSDEDDD